MIRPPFMARVAAGLALTAYEETLKLPSTAVALPMTTVSQILQTTMRIQQTMTSLAIKGDQLFELLGAAPAEAPAWATFDEDVEASPGGSETTPGRFALYSMPPATEATIPVSAAPRPASGKPVEAGGAGDAGSAPAKSGSAKSGSAKSGTAKSATAKAGPKSTAAKPSPAKPSPAKSTAAKIDAGRTATGGAAADGTTAGRPPAKKTAKKSPTEPATGAAVPEIVELLDYPSLTLAQLRARMRTLSVEDLRALLEYESATRARDPFETMLSNRIANATAK